jgi:hypothetical protein
MRSVSGTLLWRPAGGEDRIEPLFRAGPAGKTAGKVREAFSGIETKENNHAGD